MTRYSDDLTLAHLLADTADRITLARFRARDLHVTTKPDLTPVSDADIAVEKELRATVAHMRPHDGIIGEEYGLKSSNSNMESDMSGRWWIIDPIDGTKNFIRGVPIWATLIALMDDGVPVVGMVSAPGLHRRWWAATGHGAYAGCHPTSATAIRVSGIHQLSDASLCYSSLGGWEARGQLEAILDLMRSTWRQRSYGDFFGYMLVAEGAVDIMIEPELSLWDIAALIPIVTEAGGAFTDVNGRSGPHGGSAVATNGALHTKVMSRLGMETAIRP